MLDTSAKAELKDRVEQKKHALQARLDKLKAEAKKTAREDREDLEALAERGRRTFHEDIRDIKDQLDQLDQMLQQGWDNISEKAASKLDRWLAAN